MTSTPLVYNLPDSEDTYRLMEKAAESLGPGSESMVKNSLEQGRTGRAVNAILAGMEADAIQDKNTILNYGGSI